MLSLKLFGFVLPEVLLYISYFKWISFNFVIFKNLRIEKSVNADVSKTSVNADVNERRF